VPRKTAEILAGLRARARPRDLLARLRVLLLAFGLLNVAGIFPILLFSRSDPPFWILGVVAPAALALAWLPAYRSGCMGPLGDAVTIGSMCLIGIAVDDRWHGYLFVLLAVAVILTSGYGSLPHVLLRTAGLAAIELGEGLADPAAFTIALVFAIGFVIVACLMSGMAASLTAFNTVFTCDLYQPHLSKGASDAQTLAAGRWATGPGRRRPPARRWRPPGCRPTSTTPPPRPPARAGGARAATAP